MLDNLECAQLSSEPALVQPESYNIYRDNEFIANVTGTSYTEETPTPTTAQPIITENTILKPVMPGKRSRKLPYIT